MPARRSRYITALCLVASVWLTGCTTTLLQSDHRQIPLEMLRVSDSVRANFIYDNSRLPQWPPRRSVFGKNIGNCMTYSQLISERLRALGYQPRARNVLAPELVREHVVTIATDVRGIDWVFDNRFRTPYRAERLHSRYEFETARRTFIVGAQRRSWRQVSSARVVSPRGMDALRRP